MPKFTNDDVKAMMNENTKIRNLAMVGPMGCGKTSGVDCLGAECGLVSEDQIGEARYASVRKDEKEKGCSVKASLVSMIVEDSLLHVLDTPGHSEYVQEMQICAPLADGAIFVVDGSKGELASAATGVMKMCKTSKITPVLFLNRLDTSLLVTKKVKG